MQVVDQKQEMIQDAVSLGVAGSGFTIAGMADLATLAHQVTLIVSSVLVIVTLCHRVFIFYRALKSDKD